MAIKKIDPPMWTAYFDAFSKKLSHSNRKDYAEIRVLSTEIGMQPETTWLPLDGITYDHKDDLLEVVVENLDHLIFHPEEIYVDETEDGFISSLEVVCEDGVKEIIEVR